MSFETIAIEVDAEQADSARSLAAFAPMTIPNLLAANEWAQPFVESLAEAGMSVDRLIEVVQYIVNGCDIRLTVDGELAMRIVINEDETTDV